jgi:hypothetical protein
LSAEEVEVTIEIVCTELPGLGDDSLHLGIQHDEEIIEFAPADAARILFKPVLRARRNADGSANFLGPFAHGPKNERFIYLNWVSKQATAPPAMVGRIKLQLNHITWTAVQNAAERNKPIRVTLALTNARGKPVMASVRQDTARWDLPWDSQSPIPRKKANKKMPVKRACPAAVDRGVTFDTVREVARAFPGVEDSTSYGTPALKVKGKLIVRLHQSGECFVLRVDLQQRDALLRSQPAVFYLTDHYVDHPWVLVRFLTVDPDALPGLIEGAWRLVAPASLLAKSGRES